MKLNNQKNNLDERQEQTLLMIESNGFWIGFWGLFIAMLVELFFYGFDVKALAGEWIVFMIMAVVLVIRCMKNGIWDRKLRPTPKTNLIVSLIAGGVMGVFNGVMSYRSYHKPGGACAVGIVFFIIISVLLMAMLSIMGKAYQSRVKKLEEGEDEE